MERIALRYTFSQSSLWFNIPPEVEFYQKKKSFISRISYASIPTAYSHHHFNMISLNTFLIEKKITRAYPHILHNNNNNKKPPNSIRENWPMDMPFQNT